MKSRKRSGGYRIFQGTRLDVPRAEKDDAKSAGARWNWRERYWYVPPWETDLKKFQRWLPADYARPGQCSSDQASPIGPRPIPDKTGWSVTITRTLIGAIAICAVVFILVSAERKPYRGHAVARQANTYASPRAVSHGAPPVSNSPLLPSSPSPQAVVAQKEADKHVASKDGTGAGQLKKNSGRTDPSVTHTSSEARLDSSPDRGAARAQLADLSNSRPPSRHVTGGSGRSPVLVAALCRDGARLKAAGEDTCSKNGGVVAWVGADGSYIAPAIQKQPAYAGVRIGAWCRDGSRSSATGRGACSHHGGVAQWIIGE